MDHNTLIHHRGRWIEPAPERCANGHPFTPRRMLVGSHVCSCEIHHHRTHRCLDCDAVTYTPPLGEHCIDAAFDGRART